MAPLVRLQPMIFAVTSALLLACSGDASETKAASEADAPAGPADPAGPAAEADAPAPSSAAAPKAVAGLPAKADLSELARLAGPKAEGNVPEDIAAAEQAKTCKIVDGDLGDCKAAEDAYMKARNNFVVAKAPAHVQTIFNLVAHESAPVRMLVLDADPVRYLDTYGDDVEPTRPLYEGLIAAAAAETDPGVRGAFAWEITDVPRESVPNLDAILGAIAETYAADEEGTHIVSTIADGCGEDFTPCRDALLGVAGRNPDPVMRLSALQKLEYAEPAVPAATWCPLVRDTLDALKPDDDLPTALGLFTGETVDCAAHFDAWLSSLPARAKAGTLTYDELSTAIALADREDGKARQSKLREVGKTLQGIVGAEHELRDSVDDLAGVEAS